MEQLDNLDSFLKMLGVGRRSVDDPFFNNTYNCIKVFERKGVTVEDEEELCHEVMKEFPCNACAATFQNLLEYELHYHDYHHFVCAECKKWRPTARLLEIHIQETHDSFFKVLAERQPMYQCFVSECDIKFKSQIERQEHCRKIHEFPKNYRYDESANAKSTKKSENNTPMDIDETNKKKNSKVHFKSKSMQKTFSQRNVNLPLTTDNSNNVKNEKKLPLATMFIPRQIQQKSYAKNLTKNQQMERNVLESESIMELGDSLPAT